jgi:hypothetical protein
VALIAATGLRRNTIAQLDFTDDEAGHLIVKDDCVVLNVPRHFFKEPDSSFFGSKSGQSDYYNQVPNVFWLVEIFSQYVSVSRPFLLSQCHPDCDENPLFITSARGKTARLSPESASAIYFKMVERHLMENKYRGTGISHVWACGPHSARHIRGTAIIKKTGSFKLAADANQHTESVARKHYARITTEDRNRVVNSTLFGDRIKTDSHKR